MQYDGAAMDFSCTFQLRINSAFKRIRILQDKEEEFGGEEIRIEKNGKAYEGGQKPEGVATPYTEWKFAEIFGIGTP